jgi:L-lactate dehydrogenase complex protein LldF
MNAQPLNFVPGQRIPRARAAAGGRPIRTCASSFRGAMDFLIGKRAAQFPGRRPARAPARARRTHPQVQPGSPAGAARTARAQADRERRPGALGRESPNEANRIIIDIARRHSTKLMVKGKSMVSEEIELNHAMADAGMEALESDMGEYIVQLDGEKPSHIIMPAIHKTKQQIARLFAEKVPGRRLYRVGR